MSPREEFIFCSLSRKLMFVDILGRIKQWSGIVQNKLDACKNEIGNLRKELLARACEIDIKTREIEDLKAQITDYQNARQLDSESLKDRKTVGREQKEDREDKVRFYYLIFAPMRSKNKRKLNK